MLDGGGFELRIMRRVDESNIGEAGPELSLLGMDEFLTATDVILLLLDLEFTCWDNSLHDEWLDPERPPEVIEIALVAYDMVQDAIGDHVTSFVRPQRNVELSVYCQALLNISQTSVSQAPLLGTVIARVEDWMRLRGLAGTPTCSWGANDRLFLARDARRSDCKDPFQSCRHVDLRSLFRLALGDPTDAACDRDRVRTVLGLLPNLNRHRALDDALDLVQFCRRLRVHRAPLVP